MTLHTKRGEYSFFTNSHMSRQALDFEDMIEKIGGLMMSGDWSPVDFRVYGDGLLPCYAASIGLHAKDEFNLEFCGKEKAA